MGISKKDAIWVWTGITAALWLAWLILRLTIGGDCPRPELSSTFDRTAYLGRWYEMFRDTTVPFESHDCATATYYALDPNYIDVNNIEYDTVNQEFPRGEEATPARAQCSFYRNGHCQVKFFELSPWSDYKVIDTDLTSYSIVYGCDSFIAGMVKFEWLWVLTRDPLEVNSADWTTMQNTVFPSIQSKLPNYDPNTRLRTNIQTTGSGCQYTAYP